MYNCTCMRNCLPGAEKYTVPVRCSLARFELKSTWPSANVQLGRFLNNNELFNQSKQLAYEKLIKPH